MKLLWKFAVPVVMAMIYTTAHGAEVQVAVAANFDAILLKRGEDNPAAHALLDCLQSDTAKDTIYSYGYTL